MERKNETKIIVIGTTCLWCFLLTIALATHLDIKNQKERKAKDFFREEVRKECYVEGDKKRKFVCDCFIEEALKHNDPNTLLIMYNKDNLSTIKQITSDYFNVCLNKYTKAKRKGEI